MDIQGREKNWCLCCYFLGLRRREDACRAAACCAALVFGKESCRQIDEHQLLLDSMEGGTGGPAAWWSLGASHILCTSRTSIFF